MTEQQVERDLRDSIASTIYSGTSEIQRNIIANGLGL
jgi:alkylation response protein AidB-like acyl-CoA dehydrogenase